MYPDGTLATLSPTSSVVEKAAALAAIGTEFGGLTAAITSATTSIKGLTVVSKRAEVSAAGVNVEIESRQLGELALLGAALALLLLEVFATISATVAALGLGMLLFIFLLNL